MCKVVTWCHHHFSYKSNIYFLLDFNCEFMKPLWNGPSRSNSRLASEITSCWTFLTVWIFGAFAYMSLICSTWNSTCPGQFSTHPAQNFLAMVGGQALVSHHFLNMHWTTYVIVMIVDVLAPNRHQAISICHADSDVDVVSQKSNNCSTYLSSYRYQRVTLYGLVQDYSNSIANAGLTAW